MKIIRAFPPNYKAINARFNVRGKPVIFCYGDRIYNPMNTDVDRPLIVHESVHSARQGNDPDAWWKRYLESAEFRLSEEIPAHQAEFRCLGDDKSLRRIAERLSSALYGKMVSFEEAIKLVSHAYDSYVGVM